MKKQKKAPKTILSAVLRGLHTGGIIQEWARSIKKGRDAAMFANMFLEMMRDPVDHELRKNASAFLMFADTRTWDEILEQLSPIVDKATLRILESGKAKDFYDAWKYMVLAQVREYWDKFVKGAKKGKRKTG